MISFVCEAGRPFHPERFADFLDAFPDAVGRSKGHFWLAERDELALELNVAGQSIRIAPAGEWVAALPPEEREAQLEAYPELGNTWNDEWGDRGSQLVVIGIEMDHKRISGQLERCLLTDAEMDAKWTEFADRFPTFEEPEAIKDDTPEEHDGQAEIELAD